MQYWDISKKEIKSYIQRFATYLLSTTTTPAQSLTVLYVLLVEYLPNQQLKYLLRLYKLDKVLYPTLGIALPS